jgi:hypothetical protein
MVQALRVIAGTTLNYGGCLLAGDEVVTTSDYGPDSGPNILLLRGKVVTADDQSLRMPLL